MKRIRSNRGGLYPTSKPKRAGFEDKYYEVICHTCKKKILKSEGRITTHKDGIIKKFHWGCVPDMKKTYEVEK